MNSMEQQDGQRSKRASVKKRISVRRSLRDYFAVHATEEDVARYRVYGRNSQEQAKYEYADAMLEARKS